MKDYIERTVLKLYREHSKDELVAYLKKENEMLKQELGFLTSEKQELEHMLREAKQEAKIKLHEEIAHTDMYRSLKEKYDTLLREHQKLNINYSVMLSKIYSKGGGV